MTTNIVFNDEKLKDFYLRLVTRQGHLLLSLLFNIILEVLARPVRQGKKTKGIQIKNEEVKIMLRLCDLYVRHPKYSTRKETVRSNESDKVAGSKINI